MADCRITLSTRETAPRPAGTSVACNWVARCFSLSLSQRPMMFLPMPDARMTSALRRAASTKAWRAAVLRRRVRRLAAPGLR